MIGSGAMIGRIAGKNTAGPSGFIMPILGNIGLMVALAGRDGLLAGGAFGIVATTELEFGAAGAGTGAVGGAAATTGAAGFCSLEYLSLRSAISCTRSSQKTEKMQDRWIAIPGF